MSQDHSARLAFSSIAVTGAATLYERAASLSSLDSSTAGWIAFIAFSVDQPGTLSFGDAWSEYPGDPRLGRNGGSFVISSERPADPAAYLEAVLKRVAELNRRAGFAYRYLFWGDPASPATTIATVAFVTTDVGKPGQVVGGSTTIATRNVGVVIANSAHIDGDVATSSIRFAANGSADIVLLASKYAPRTIDTLDTDVMVALDGPNPGTLAFGMTLSVATDPRQDDFTLLDVGLKYFTERGGRIKSLRYPVFGPTVDGSTVPFDVSYDPLRPLDHGRTCFTFRHGIEEDGSGQGDCEAMESALRDEFVHAVQLVPQRGASQLVLQEDRVSIGSGTAAQRDFYYMVPAGPFKLRSGGSTPPATRMMCGMSPLESVVFDPPGSILTFHPDGLAFSPLLADATGSSDAPRLTDRYRTAWATVTARTSEPVGPAPTYLSQATGAALYGHGENPDVPYLEHRETPAAVLRDSSVTGSFPIAAYSRLILGGHPDGFTAEDTARLERDVLSVERRARIQIAGSRPTRDTVASPSLNTDGPSTVMTPQGFVVELDGDGGWQRLHLAQTLSLPDPERGSPTTKALSLESVDDVLRGAFQANQQFLVITEPKLPWKLAPEMDGVVAANNPATTVFANELRPQGWPFRIRVGGATDPGDYRNVLIFKFCDGSIEDRIDDVARWTAAEEFNSDPAELASWLRAYIDSAKQLAAGPDSAYFSRFVDAVTSPTWRGILALRVDVDASALPPELRGLAAGIDLDAFNAHHLGIDLSFVDTSGGGLVAHGSSSLFATVFYEDPAYAAGLAGGANPDLPIPVPGNGDYAFRVLSLKTLFVNAEIAAFASKSQVTLNRIFGDLVGGLTLGGQPAPSNSLVLYGTYEDHDGVGVYSFGTDADARFLLVSNLWRGIQTVRATFSTLRSPISGTVLSRFSFRGFLDFARVFTDDGTTRTPFDLLSFGGDGNKVSPSGTGLPFSEMHLDMSFDTSSPATPSFAFEIDQMGFAPTTEQARPDSLYARLPLALTGITSGTSAPSDLGYLSVNALGLPTEPLGDEWFGLTYSLGLGNPGALASPGAFTARLLLAWAPLSQGNGYRLALGLTLPGSSGTARAFSLQGVIKVTVDRILLYRDPASATFVLRLTNVALSLLGVSLPPGTSTALIIFGNPDPGQRDTVGWYAAVNREKKPKPPTLAAMPRSGDDSIGEG